MEKFLMCRICLVENVRMHVVVDKNLHQLYEKLTDIPFVTEDSRPILACFFCYAKLRKCFSFLRKCLDAEELFAQMMDGGYEPKSLVNHDHIESFSGFIKTPIEHTSIVDNPQTVSIAIKEELPADFEDIIEPKEENLSDDLERENVDNSCPNVEFTRRSESHSESDIPLMRFKIEVEEELVVSNNKMEDRNLESENAYNSCLDVEDIPPLHSESDSEGDVPLRMFKTEVEEELEVSKNKRRAVETSSAAVAKKPKLDARRIKLEDTIAAELKRNEQSNLKDSANIAESVTYIKESYKCDLRSSNLVNKLKKHTRTQSLRKSYNCDVCQRIFSQKSNLTSHIRIHTGEKPYKCNICQRSFSIKDTLTKHVRLHTGEKPNKCDVCQRSFTQKSALTKHIRIHTGEKSLKCDLCKSSFTQKSALTKHIRIHTGEKSLKCDVCQRSFTQKSALTKHIRIHTGEKSLKV